MSRRGSGTDRTTRPDPASSLDPSPIHADPLEVAPALLNALVTANGVTVRLTEVEAYLGEIDPASHAFRGPTPRNAAMFGPPWHLYVYRSHGIHVCANVVCWPEGVAGGVLMRAGEVIDGHALARERRPAARVDRDLARGPGRLGAALGLSLDDGGTDLAGDRIRLRLPDVPATAVAAGPRVGVSRAGGPEHPWRFWIAGDPTVSPYRAHPALRQAGSPG